MHLVRPQRPSSSEVCNNAVSSGACTALQEKAEQSEERSQKTLRLTDENDGPNKHSPPRGAAALQRPPQDRRRPRKLLTLPPLGKRPCKRPPQQVQLPRHFQRQWREQQRQSRPGRVRRRWPCQPQKPFRNNCGNASSGSGRRNCGGRDRGGWGGAGSASRECVSHRLDRYGSS